MIKWREIEAQLLDDKPDNILSDATMTKLLKIPTKSLDDLKSLIGTKHADLLKGHIVGLFRLCQEHLPFFERTFCHKCEVAGHSAKQCNQSIDRGIEKRIYQANPEKKTAQNRRRRLNLARNRRLRKEQNQN